MQVRVRVPIVAVRQPPEQAPHDVKIEPWTMPWWCTALLSPVELDRHPATIPGRSPHLRLRLWLRFKKMPRGKSEIKSVKLHFEFKM